MLKRIFTVMFFGGALVFFYSCSPGLGKKLRVDNIFRFWSARVISPKTIVTKVRVGTFEDQRAYTEVGEIDGRLLQPDGNVALNVQLALEDLLRDQGTYVSPTSDKVLVGQILEWRVQVTPGFPTTHAQAKAVVRVELRDSTYAVLYTATYSGSGEAKHPVMTQAKVEQVLSDAMLMALAGVIESNDLMGRLRE
ncbi:MAG: hypothetical protein GX589_03600 [Deltaproteobacteria bacterium]|nr:hypothetical protein [Deltaproteobacteria bacterium]